MNSLSRKLRWFAGLAAVVLVSLAGKPLTAQAYWPQDGSYNQPQYQQPQYPQPQYAQPQYPRPQVLTDQPVYQQGYAPQQPGYAPQDAAQAPMSPDQLEQLVAPIALYPDALVAQILAGSTYPAQIAAADQMVHSMGMADPAAMATAASAQTMWDPSIKALTAYPQVLDMLAGNLQWATVLGNAYYNQPQDVLQTVQVLRMRAEQAGTLVNTPQMQVVQNAGYISLAPPTPDVMYVPTYNPWTAYGAPVQPYPGFSFTGILGTLANAFVGGWGGGGYGSGFGGGGPLQFLASFALGAFNHTPFGLIAWGLDWLVNALTFNNSDYYTHSASVRDWGLPHGGPRYFPRAYPAGGERARFGGGYNHQPIPVHGGAGYGGGRFGGDRFGGNTVHPQGWINRPQQGWTRTDQPRQDWPRQGWTNRPQQPAFGRNEMRPGLPQQQTFNHGPEPVFRNQPNSGFAPRAVAPQPVRPNAGFNSGSEPYRGAMGGMQGGMQPSRPAYPGSYGSGYSGYGGYGNTGRPGNMAYAPPPNFKQENKGGGFHMFGGGREKNSWGGGGYKEPKMPKMQSFKAPREHFGGGGGGHFGGGHSGGGHGSGGHHH